jgi:hypothetical protein
VTTETDDIARAIDARFLSEGDLEDLTPRQRAEVVKEQWSIYDREMAVAKHNEEETARAKERAAKAEKPVERQRFERQVAVYTEQAQQHTAAATRKAISFGKEAASLFREDMGRPAVKALADQLKPTVERPVKIHQIDDLAARIAGKLERFANGEDRLSKDLEFLKANSGDLSERAAEGLRQSFTALVVRLERMQAALTTSTGPRA